MFGLIRIALSMVVSWSTATLTKWWKPDTARFGINRKHIEISYRLDGREHTVYVPYRASLRSSMATTTVIASHSGNGLVLNQQPGVPLMVSADDLGYSQIEVHSEDGCAIFHNSEVPSID